MLSTQNPLDILREAIRRWGIQRNARVMLVTNTDVFTVATLKVHASLLDPTEPAGVKPPESTFVERVYILGPQEVRLSATAADVAVNLREMLIVEVMKRLDDLIPMTPESGDTALAIDEMCSISRDDGTIYFLFTAGGSFPSDAMPALPRLIGQRLIQHCRVIQHELRRGLPPIAPEWARIRGQIEGTNKLLELALGTGEHRIEMPAVFTFESTPPFLSGLLGAAGAIVAEMQKSPAASAA